MGRVGGVLGCLMRKMKIHGFLPHGKKPNSVERSATPAYGAGVEFRAEEGRAMGGDEIGLLTLADAKAQRRCRICGGAIRPSMVPSGWQEEFRAMTHPVAVTLEFGAEFAHTACLTGRAEDSP